VIDRDLSDALQSVAGAATLLVAADYDGTLSPIVDDPDRALPHEAALRALEYLTGLPGVHVAIVSGRSRSALIHLTGAPDGVRLIGTHGAEWGDDAAEWDPMVDAVIEALTAVTARFSGTLLEAKPRGGALHYRHAADRPGAAAAAITVGRSLGTRVIEGKEVVELLVGDTDKGSAVFRLGDLVGADAIVFLGDDTTDEDVFARLGEGDVGVKVGPEETAARYRVADPDTVAEVLRMLAIARDS